MMEVDMEKQFIAGGGIRTIIEPDDATEWQMEIGSPMIVRECGYGRLLIEHSRRETSGLLVPGAYLDPGIIRLRMSAPTYGAGDPQENLLSDWYLDLVRPESFQGVQRAQRIPLCRQASIAAGGADDVYGWTMPAGYHGRLIIDAGTNAGITYEIRHPAYGAIPPVYGPFVIEAGDMTNGPACIPFEAPAWGGEIELYIQNSSQAGISVMADVGWTK